MCDRNVRPLKSNLPSQYGYSIIDLVCCGGCPYLTFPPPDDGVERDLCGNPVVGRLECRGSIGDHDLGLAGAIGFCCEGSHLNSFSTP